MQVEGVEVAGGIFGGGDAGGSGLVFGCRGGAGLGFVVAGGGNEMLVTHMNFEVIKRFVTGEGSGMTQRMRLRT